MEFEFINLGYKFTLYCFRCQPWCFKAQIKIIDTCVINICSRSLWQNKINDVTDIYFSVKASWSFITCNSNLALKRSSVIFFDPLLFKKKKKKNQHMTFWCKRELNVTSRWRQKRPFVSDFTSISDRRSVIVVYNSVTDWLIMSNPPACQIRRVGLPPRLHFAQAGMTGDGMEGWKEQRPQRRSEKEEWNQPLPCSLVWHSLSEVGHSEEGGCCLSQQMLITQNRLV